MKIKLIAQIKDVIIGYMFGPETDVTVGREIGNVIAPIIDSISRHHAHIFFKDGEWKVEDLGSTNGSLINGNKIEGVVPLKNNDRLRFGLIDMSVAFEGTAEVPPVIAAEPPPAVAPIPAPVAEPPPAAAPIPAPVAEPPPTPALEPVAELEPLTPLEPLAPLEPLSPVEPISPITPVRSVQKTALKLPTPGAIRKPAIGGIKTGVKLPTKPSLPSGLKLPPKMGMKVGLKLPPKKV